MNIYNFMNPALTRP